MGLVVHQEKVNPALGTKLQALCPFKAISYTNGVLRIGMECKVCKACVGKSEGAITFEEDQIAHVVDKNEWQGVLVFCEHYQGKIHDVTFELLGKAKELASVTGQKVLALMIGCGIVEEARELYCYGSDEVYAYDAPEFENFLIEPFTNAFADLVARIRPSAVLVGATNVGRSLAPRVAARLGTGLTADCTSLEMMPNTDLVQIRPAFGGNIMARIMTPRHRPQFCTVRYKIFTKPERTGIARAVHLMQTTDAILSSRAEILDIVVKPKDVDLSEADVIVQVGRGVKNVNDLPMIQAFADAIGARMACTRPLVENNWFNAKQQIGLSGRTVKPKLLVCIGVSGAIQTVAGMKGSDCIVAINSEPQASIFDIADYGFVGDLYEIIPALLKKLGKGVRDVPQMQ